METYTSPLLTAHATLPTTLAKIEVRCASGVSLSTHTALHRLIAAVALSVSAVSVHAQLEVSAPLLVDVDATGLAPGTLGSITNNGTLGGFFQARGGGSTVPNVVAVDGGGTVGILFDGGDYLQHVATIGGALVPAPAGLVGVNPTCTIEAWVLKGAIDRDECILAWGKRGGPDVSNHA